MKNLILIPCMLMSTGCGKVLKDLFDKDGDPPTTHKTDPDFNKYISILESHGVHTNSSIIFSDRSNGVAGTCTRWSNGYREIAVDPKYWNETLKHQDSYRLELLAHEIGHCDYNLEHDNSSDDYNKDDFNSPCPIDSIMYSTNFGGECFYKDEAIDPYYLEIF